MAAALLVVPGLLVLFHRLSRTPPAPGASGDGLDLEAEAATGGSRGARGSAAVSVADEAEMWLRSHNS